jgi:hypothetical protein
MLSVWKGFFTRLTIEIVILQVSIPGEEKVVLSLRGEAVASLREEKLVFTGRAEPEDCNF